MLDSFNRTINYLRVSVTDRCNLRCTYCMPAEGIKLKSHHDMLSYEEILLVTKAAAKLGIDKIRLTGGEPLVRRGISELVAMIRRIPEIREVALTTNAILLPALASDLKAAGLDRLNISLDTLNPEKYSRLTRVGRLEEALAGIDAAIRAGFVNTKLNMVLMPDFNLDELPAMRLFCHEKGLILQRIQGYSLHEPKTSPRARAAERPGSCRDCNRIRLTSDGFLKPCLFSDQEIELDFQDLGACLRRAVKAKPRHGSQCLTRENWQIGG